MRILIVHNLYQWPGGEDAVVRQEAELLRSRGHEVIEEVADNKEILADGRFATARALWQAAWSRQAHAAMAARLREVGPDVAHLHNFWYALSPSVLAACHEAGCRVVLTLHNFRLLCAGGVLLNHRGEACDACVGSHPWRGVLNRCYHRSFFASYAVARMQVVNRKRRTWTRHVDRFLVPSDFCRQTFARGGLPADRIRVKPNFVADPVVAGERPPPPPEGQKRVLFVGRLSREKGLATLLAAWRHVDAGTDASLHLVGDGPLRHALEEEARGMRVTFTGRLSPEEVLTEIGRSHLLVYPSECCETFGRAIIEAHACARPVVATTLGGPGELVEDGITGTLVPPHHPDRLATAMTELLANPARAAACGNAGREVYLQRFTPPVNYDLLMDAYGGGESDPAAAMFRQDPADPDPSSQPKPEIP